jgi:hypothetical protein
MSYGFAGERYQRGLPHTKTPLFLWLQAAAENLLLLRVPGEGFLSFRLERGAPLLGGVEA